MYFFNKINKIFFSFFIVIFTLFLYNVFFTSNIYASSDCPTVELDGSVYKLSPCTIDAEMVDGDGNKDFQFKIIQSGVSRDFGFSVYGYGEGLPVYATLGTASGGALYPEKTVDRYFNDNVLDSDGVNPKKYSGYLPVWIYHGSWNGVYKELKLNLNLTVKPSLNQQNNTPSTDNANISSDASSDNFDDIYKSIVKINTFIPNTDDGLVLIKSGTGFIINSSGVILTNYHVTNVENDFDGSEEDTAYQICIPKSPNKEPECVYTASVIAVDKDTDVALLKIKPVPTVSALYSYPYLNINKSSSPKIGEQINVFGYPTIGGNTVTMTQGTVSGMLNKYGRSWIKTDAVISFGNSGGAAVNKDGKVIGITTKAYKDTVSSLGYLIDILSIKNWIDNNINKQPKLSALESRAIDYIKIENKLKDLDVYVSMKPPYQISKKQGWDFEYYPSGNIKILKKDDSKGGFIKISATKLPYKVSYDDAMTLFQWSLNTIGIQSMVEVVKEEIVSINGIEAKKITISAAGETLVKYFVLHREYIISIEIVYGEQNKDKDAIDSMVNNFKLLPFSYGMSSKTEYENSDPYFYIKNGNGFFIQYINTKQTPIELYMKDLPVVIGTLSFYKLEKGEKIDNNILLQKQLQLIQQSNQLGSLFDYKMEVLSSDISYKLGDKYKNILSIETVEKVNSTGKVLAYNINYYIPYNQEMYAVFAVGVYTDDKGTFDKAKKYLNNFLLENFSINKKISQKSSDSLSTVKKIKNKSMYKRLKGKILLKVESKGEAYYIHPQNDSTYYLGRPKDAFEIMRNLGQGITNDDLLKIPVAVYNMSGKDTDKDGLSDEFEDAIGTDKNKKDTDGDGFDDKQEIMSGYDPLGIGKVATDKNFTRKHQGKIFIQVEGNGEAWYINPEDNKRYFLGRPKDAFEIMRNLGLGISNKDFDDFVSD